MDRFKLILESARAGEIELFTSTLTIAECLHADSVVSDEVKAKFKSLLVSGTYVKLITVSPFIASDARDIRWEHGVNLKHRGADYIHLASAVSRGCDELHTTDGKNFLSRAEEIENALRIRVISPRDTNLLPGDRLQGSLYPEEH